MQTPTSENETQKSGGLEKRPKEWVLVYKPNHPHPSSQFTVRTSSELPMLKSSLHDVLR